MIANSNSDDTSKRVCSVNEDLENSGPAWDTISHPVQCPQCGYELRGISDPRCPECGLHFRWEVLLSRAAQFNSERYGGAVDVRRDPMLLRVGFLLFRPFRFWNRYSFSSRSVGSLATSSIVAACLVLGLSQLLFHVAHLALAPSVAQLSPGASGIAVIESGRMIRNGLSSWFSEVTLERRGAFLLLVPATILSLVLSLALLVLVPKACAHKARIQWAVGLFCFTVPWALLWWIVLFVLGTVLDTCAYAVGWDLAEPVMQVGLFVLAPVLVWFYTLPAVRAWSGRSGSGWRSLVAAYGATVATVIVTILLELAPG